MPNTNLSDNSEIEPGLSPKKKNGVIIGVVAAIVIVGVAAAVSIAFATPSDIDILPEQAIEETNTIYSNIFVNGISVGGLSIEEAESKVLSSISKNELAKTIELVCGNESHTYTLADFGVAFDVDAAIETAYGYARAGDTKARKEAIEALEDTPLQIEAMCDFNETLIEEVLRSLEEKINIEPINATMDRVGGEFSITPEQNGVAINYSEAYNAIVELVSNNSTGTVNIEINEVEPKFKSASFKEATVLIGSYSSKISGSAVGRNKNLDNAAAKINDCVVYPGEVFSTNAAFGEMTVANGYTMAPVIIGGELVDGMGGGVCQISSTLYMALLHAELEIVERQNHSQKVGYADYGYDATLAGDYIDLKFRNDTEYPITIESYIEQNVAYVNIYGYEKDNPLRSIEFYSTHVDTIAAPAETVLDDDTLPLGERVVKSAAKNGVKYNLYKIVYEDGKEVSVEQINQSYYRPKGAVILVGTGKAVENSQVVEGEGAVDEENIETNEPAEEVNLPVDVQVSDEVPTAAPQEYATDDVYQPAVEVPSEDLPIIE